MQACSRSGGEAGHPSLATPQPVPPQLLPQRSCELQTLMDSWILMTTGLLLTIPGTAQHIQRSVVHSKAYSDNKPGRKKIVLENNGIPGRQEFHQQQERAGARTQYSCAINDNGMRCNPLFADTFFSKQKLCCLGLYKPCGMFYFFLRRHLSPCVPKPSSLLPPQQ